MRYKIGDIVEHTGTRLRAAVQETKPCRDGTQKLLVFTALWWNSRHVTLLGRP